MGTPIEARWWGRIRTATARKLAFLLSLPDNPPRRQVRLDDNPIFASVSKL